MFVEILIAILLGVTAGTITGLIPGIHVNLVSVIIISASGILSKFTSVEPLVAFIVALALTHTFLDTIPSIFLGAPDETSLSVLPGHAMLLEGKGLEAVKLTVIGSLAGLVISGVLFVILEKFLALIYPILNQIIAELLILVIIFMLKKSKDKKRTFVLIALSGILGVIVLNSRTENSLFPLLTGFFGTATLLFGLKEKNKIPKQKKSTITEVNKKSIPSIFLGTISGFMTAFLPGLGASSAAAISSTIKKDNSKKNFLVMIGAISTVNFFMSIATLNVIDKARNGAIVAVQQLSKSPDVVLMIFASLIAGGVAVLIALFVSKRFLEMFEKINYTITVKSTILFLVILTIILSGIQGILILFISTIIGFYANWKGLPRNTMMACIMIPVMIYFL